MILRRLAGLTMNAFSGRFVPPGVTPFVIVYSPRTGSNYLAAALDSHPDILCHHEVFNPGSIHRSLSYKGSDLSFGTVAERDRDPWTFLHRVYSFQNGVHAVGFKLAPRVNDWALLSLLLARRVRKVLLGRHSWLHAYTSELIAAKTQMWMRRETAESNVPQQKVRVDAAHFRTYARKRRLFYRLCQSCLKLTGQRFFRLDYEHIGDPATMASLLSYLGVDPNIELHIRTARQNSPHLEDRIDNYEELAAELRGSPDDPGPGGA